MSEQNEFAAWAIVEVLGHRSYAGQVSEQHIAGAGFVRIEIPEVNGKGGGTKLISPRSIFAIHPTTEDIAKAYVAQTHGHPIDLFARLGQTTQRALAAGEDDEWDEREDMGDGRIEDDSEVPF